MNEILDWLITLVHSVDPVARTLTAGLGIMLETSILIGLIVPGDTIVIIASTGVTNTFEYLALVLVVILGALCGESIGFALGHFFGPRIRDSKVGGWVGRENWMRAENYLDRRGGIAVFVSRFLPVLHSVVPLVVGMSTMSYRRFIAWTLPACTIWAAAYSAVGWLAASAYRELSTQLNYASYIFVGIIALFLLVMYLVKRGLQVSQNRQMLLPGDGDANTREDD